METGLKKIVTGLIKDPTKIKTIAQAWISAQNPQDWQKELAEARYNICLDCEAYRSKRDLTGDEYCFDCGCPIRKKIFSVKLNDCPRKKWGEIDEFYQEKLKKIEKTLL